MPGWVEGHGYRLGPSLGWGLSADQQASSLVELTILTYGEAPGPGRAWSQVSSGACGG